MADLLVQEAWVAVDPNMAALNSLFLSPLLRPWSSDRFVLPFKLHAKGDMHPTQ